MKGYLKKPVEKQRKSNFGGLQKKLSYPTKILSMQSTTERNRLSWDIEISWRDLKTSRGEK
jgi:hypothetical protein